MSNQIPEKDIRYVAFLRGVNVGGNSLLKMSELKKVFEELGFIDITTILASGNVVFSSSDTQIESLRKKIEEKLLKRLNLNITVIIRTQEEIRSLISLDPFENISITPRTRIHVTFLLEEPDNSLKLPYISPEKDFTIILILNRAVCCVVEPSETRGTTDLMKFLEKEFGKNITTRTWKTVCKIAGI